MSSVYCTITMSIERYVRICHLCQMRTPTLLTETNFKFYIIAVVLGPLLFYAPKFFEIRTENTIKHYHKILNCSEVLGPEFENVTIEELNFLWVLIHWNVNFKNELHNCTVAGLQILGFTHRVFGILLIQLEHFFKKYISTQVFPPLECNVSLWINMYLDANLVFRNLDT